MISDSDDLEQALQENLKLRRQLAANVDKAEATSQRGGIAYRLGWVLYWTCLALIGAWVLFFFYVTFMGGEDWGSTMDATMAFGIPTIILYGLGRAFRYVLSGE